jgi:hypothetical protein
MDRARHPSSLHAAVPNQGVQACQRFVLEHGRGSRLRDLARVLDLSDDEVARLRAVGPAAGRASEARGQSGYGFSELFALWHGRDPQDDEWPVPLLHERRGTYEWQQPEVALLATLVGQLGPQEIADVLTARLQRITGDPHGKRDRAAVQNQIARLGLQSSDVVGGITAAEAGRELGSAQIVYQALRQGKLVPRRVGRYIVISHEAWAGYVQLSTLKGPLGIASDKLSEFARMGYVPQAQRVNTFGVHSTRTTQFGTWYVPQAVAEQLLHDRRAGRAMPWHGKPIMDNLKGTWRLFDERRHPASCETCREIWGLGGAPATFDAYIVRYPGLMHGAKRHLTRPWSPGLTIAEVAAQARCSDAGVRRAIKTGALEARKDGRTTYVTRTNATRWIARKCPTGQGDRSWISLESAAHQYLISNEEAQRLIENGQLVSKVGHAGGKGGTIYVQRQQCVQLREREGFTEQQAAARVHLSVDSLRKLLAGVNWRHSADGLIPLVTLQAIVKRVQSRQGHTPDEAATELSVAVDWIRARIDDGTITVKHASWDDRLYITAPMLERLRRALSRPEPTAPRQGCRLRLSAAAGLAGVSTSTVIRWADAALIGREREPSGWSYIEQDIRAQARVYWTNARWTRDKRPAWLVEEKAPREQVSSAN